MQKKEKRKMKNRRINNECVERKAIYGAMSEIYKKRSMEIINTIKLKDVYINLTWFLSFSSFCLWNKENKNKKKEKSLTLMREQRENKKVAMIEDFKAWMFNSLSAAIEKKEKTSAFTNLSYILFFITLNSIFTRKKLFTKTTWKKDSTKAFRK